MPPPIIVEVCLGWALLEFPVWSVTSYTVNSELETVENVYENLFPDAINVSARYTDA